MQTTVPIKVYTIILCPIVVTIFRLSSALFSFVENRRSHFLNLLDFYPAGIKAFENIDEMKEELFDLLVSLLSFLSSINSSIFSNALIPAG